MRTSSATSNPSSTSTTRGWRYCGRSATSTTSRARTSSAAHADGVRHAELFFDPQAHTARGVPFATVVNGLHTAIEEARSELGISALLILCFLRHLPASEAMTTLEEAMPFLDRIAGVGLDSSEAGYPPQDFAEVYARARAEGLRAVAHAGEEGPPEYVRQGARLARRRTHRPRRAQRGGPGAPRATGPRRRAAHDVPAVEREAACRRPPRGPQPEAPARLRRPRHDQLRRPGVLRRLHRRQLRRGRPGRSGSRARRSWRSPATRSRRRSSTTRRRRSCLPNSTRSRGRRRLHAEHTVDDQPDRHDDE